MRSLDLARSVCERFHPGLLKELDKIPYTDRERPGSPVIDLFRIHGGVGLLIPEEYGGHGADALDAMRVQLALGAVSPSLVAAVSMHHFTTAMLYSLAVNAGRLTDEQTALLRRIVPDQRVMASGWAEGRTAQNILKPAVTARPVRDGFLLTGAKKPCSLSRSMSLLTASVAIHADDGEPELALALVPADAPGLTVHPYWGNDLLAGAESEEVRLEDVFVPAGMVVRAGADDPHRLDDLQSAGFVWFELLISAGYAGGALELVEQVLERERGSVAERASLAVDMETAVALLEGVARATGSEPGDEESVARVLVARYAVQNALPDIASRALELLGGLDFIRGSGPAQAAAALRALAFHPPSRAAAAEPLLRWFGGGELVLA
ncbi:MULTISPECIES: acyl-CoA dehydrogenase family protein [unclassified Streptomyces]|uniref:acyl-CoA dehydrogenase family protein n=1 Tax=unclassified Streptomyces TaxID=2593676 RepID=UPI0005A603EC|nr:MULTISPECIES: acyl-CoA dehydrogenase family protein [unclassified Streptomyces]MBQ1100493.1 acyl-CoA/acyl-ACP dehydrogenase [Streptomyces sp. b94]ODA73988.1 Acyl-CoA dehydrogenase fadE12 [Streptomyces sp. AVP053U2]